MMKVHKVANNQEVMFIKIILGGDYEKRNNNHI